MKKEDSAPYLEKKTKEEKKIQTEQLLFGNAPKLTEKGISKEEYKEKMLNE
jgi:hypothetical protein